MTYRKLDDRQFVGLIFSSADTLGMDYVEETRRRREKLVPLLCEVLSQEKNYQWRLPEGWAVIHAVYLLGILGDIRAIDALLQASHFSDRYDIDWLWDALAECYLRLGPAAVPHLKEAITAHSEAADISVTKEITGLWNIWEVYPETKRDIEDFLLGILRSPSKNYETRTNLIADFAIIHRFDLKPLFDEYYDKGETDLPTCPREDMDYFYGKDSRPPGFRYDLEEFYLPEKIEERRRRWEKEDAENERQEWEEFILDNIGRLGRNEPCPCGSDKKFKKCHLPWAQETLAKRREEEAINEKLDESGEAIMQEREMETELRRFLAARDQTHLFAQLKEAVVAVIKAPEDELRDRGFLSHFDPILQQIRFGSKGEADTFIGYLMDYHNALALQFAGRPGDGKLH